MVGVDLGRWLAAKLLRPGRGEAEQEAYAAGWEADAWQPNPFSDPAMRRAWREGRERAEDWADRAW